jgi:nucleoid-associated protein YgaU
LENVGEKLAAAAEKNDEKMAEELEKKVADLGLDVDDLEIEVSKGVATVTGLAADEDTIEKVVLAVGNNEGVSEVEADELVAGMTDAEKAEYKKLRKEALAAAKEKKDADAAKAARRKMSEQRRLAMSRGSRQPSKFYTVVKGDTLSKIAKEFYGDASKYPVIFEANTPMLKDPDLIYPGQVLRVPPQ